MTLFSHALWPSGLRRYVQVVVFIRAQVRILRGACKAPWLSWQSGSAVTVGPSSERVEAFIGVPRGANWIRRETTNLEIGVRSLRGYFCKINVFYSKIGAMRELNSTLLPKGESYWANAFILKIRSGLNRGYRLTVGNSANWYGGDCMI